MEVIYYNEINSFISQAMETSSAYTFSLFADKVNMLGMNSTWYAILQTKEKWDDTYLKTLNYIFNNCFDGKYGLHFEVDQAFRELSSVKKVRNKSKDNLNYLGAGSKLKKGLKDYYATTLEEILGDNRVPGLQKLIDTGVLRMLYSITIVSKHRFEGYIGELREAFIETDDYLIFGELTKIIFRVSLYDLLEHKFPPAKEKTEVLLFELLDFPLLEELKTEEIYYLREKIFPHFADFRHQTDLFREEIVNLRFEEGNFERIGDNFLKRISGLLPSLQEIIDQQIFVQRSRKMFRTLSFKLYLGISSISSMIDYFPRSGIIPFPVSEAIKRVIGRETDSGCCEMFFHLDFIPNNENIENNESKI